MPLDIVIGAQWGDEGKGRMVDLLASQAEYVARYNGGDNAGHTVTVGSQTFKLHLIPSGIIHSHTVGIMGNGMVINPEVLLDEMQRLQQAGVAISPERLAISFAAHLITPAHRALDAAQEAARGAAKIGTTLRGIGPAYTDKVARRGLRMAALLDADTLPEKLEQHIAQANHTLTRLYDAEPLDSAPIIAAYRDYATRLRPYIRDTAAILHTALRKGAHVLAEGAQGTLLDLEQGTYPFVTSSNPTAPGALLGLGLGVGCVGRVIGVTKSFQTRVGAGPFPTEVAGDIAHHLRGSGENPWDEFGTTTGRPRRVGWLDLVLLRYALRVNGVTELALTKLDILSGLDEIRICTAYRRDGRTFTDLPYGPADLEGFEPVYTTLPGWQEDLRQARQWEDLPDAACDYILHIEDQMGVPVSMVSVGPEREQVVSIV
ncbi:MAG: adenylosuccinate synthase [Anaerolineae bacterium]|nr:MAG: adenylosuccinate synthase [Anaerolineae bacterium]